MKPTRHKQLVESGYKAALSGKPCNPPTRTDLDRGSWEIGWRIGKKELKRKVCK
jgi:hypothetical protein